MKGPAGPPAPTARIPLALLAVLCLAFVPPACGKSPEQSAYEEVVATMSLQKAGQFFARYPQSRYRDRLVDDLIGWCRREGSEECWRMVVDVIPGDHPRHKDAVSEYSRRFGGHGR